MKKLPLLLTVLAAVGLLTVTTSVAHAATFHWRTTTTAPAGLPDDLHITYTGTGGSIAGISVTPAPATVGTSGGGNTIDITWAAGLAQGTVVTIKFTTAFDPVGIASGTWTQGGGNIGAVTATNEGYTAQPGASPLVILLASLAVAGAAVFALRRRTAVA